MPDIFAILYPVLQQQMSAVGPIRFFKLIVGVTCVSTK